MANIKILKHPRTLPAMHYRAIGSVAYEWNLLEVHIQSIVWHFLNLPPKEGRLLTLNQGARQKIYLFQALPLRWVEDKAVAREIKDIAKETLTLCNDRNKIVHGIWGYEPGNRKKLYLLYTKKYKEKILPRREAMTSNQINEVATHIRGLNDRLVALHSAVGAPLP